MATRRKFFITRIDACSAAILSDAASHMSSNSSYLYRIRAFGGLLAACSAAESRVRGFGSGTFLVTAFAFLSDSGALSRN